MAAIDEVAARPHPGNQFVDAGQIKNPRTFTTTMDMANGVRFIAIPGCGQNTIPDQNASSLSDATQQIKHALHDD